MQVKSKPFLVIGLWLLCALIGMLVYKTTNTPTKPFIGIWTGSTVVQYPHREVIMDLQLIVDDAKNESARLISSFSSNEASEEILQSNVTVDVTVIKRGEDKLTFSLLNPSYSNKTQLEEYIGRDLPEQGTLISGQAWAIDTNEVFLYLTLGFGEKFGAVLTRER
ncbi:hypothetical protein KP803_17765 [Vibrio sp. ZSDE26]|uniref:Uncharacterized protein n=1 Tax=Vibrio amylolyticus TaxID=2847292 RepID=A0A9X1XLU2_9VIBR|nr:hypothetical protein [Vibrio amylolyticus]MCK6265126.1 hypothetical protein [Vibrio amylolyticus]